MARELRAAVEFLESVALTLLLLRQVGPDQVEAGDLGTFQLCETLATLPVASPAAWACLARITRHILRALDEQDDPRALILHELHRTILNRADKSAALARRTGDQHGDDNATEV